MGMSFKMPSFAAGEISEKVSSRDDQERYHIGASKIRNFRVMKEGGIEKRPGWRFLGKVKDPTKTTIVVPLERDAFTTHALEFGDLYVRIWKNRANVLQLATHTASEQLQLIDADYVWTKSSGGTDEWYLLSSFDGPPAIFGKPSGVKRHFPADVDIAFIEGSIGSLASNEWVWGDNDGLDFDTLYVRDIAADLNDYAFNTYRIIIPGPLEFVTPYPEADITLLKFSASGSVLYITHNDHPFAQLARTSDTDWAYTIIDFDSSGTPVDNYDYSAEFPADNPGTDWSIEYAVTRLSPEGIESSKKSAFVQTDDQPTDPQTPPDELGDLGPVWTLDVTEPGDELNILVDFADYEWIDAKDYKANLERKLGIIIQSESVFFLCKKGTGLDGPKGGSTNLAVDPGLFDAATQTGPVQCFDTTTGTPLGVSRFRKSESIELITDTNDAGLGDRGHWMYGTAMEIHWGSLDRHSFIAFPTLWIIGDKGAFVPPGTRKFELTVETDAGYNLYRRFSKLNAIDGFSGATTFPWGRLAALDAYGGTHRVFNVGNYPTMAVELLEISGAFLDTASITPDFSREPPEPLNEFNAVDKHPGVVAFLGQRLVLAGTNLKPNRIWMSVTGDFFDFVQADAAEDDDPIERDLTTANKILYMVSAGTGSMIVFTTGSEWRVWGEGGPVTGSTINSAEASPFGVADVQPLRIGSLVLYVTKLGNQVNGIRFDLAEETYKSNSISLMSEHMISANEGSELKGWAYAETPNKTIYGFLDDGSMIGITFDEEQQVNAWHRHDSFNGLFQSFASVRAVGQDDVYGIVKRTINGSTQQYMEVLEDGDQSDQGQNFYVDSGLSLEQPEIPGTEINPTTGGAEVFNNLSINDEVVFGGFDTTTPDEDNPSNSYLHGLQFNGLRVKILFRSNTSIKFGDIVTGAPLTFTDLPTLSTLAFFIRKLVKTIYGLDHLEGETIGVLADGRDIGTHVVTNARIILQQGAADVVAGYIIDSEFETLDFSGSAGSSTLEGKKRNIQELTVHMLRTLGLRQGPAPDRMIEFRMKTQPTLNAPRALFTGKQSIPMKGSWTETGKLFLRHDSPQPATVLSITPEFDIGD